MANCPTCNQEWLWDWCIDTYRTSTGVECIERVMDVASEDPPLSYWCMCGRLLGIARTTNEGIDLTNFPPEWVDIDWDTEEHSYQGDCYDNLESEEDTDDTT